jgi:acetylglutamate kinase
VQGRRYTDEASLQIVQDVLVDEINQSLATSMIELGGQSAAVSFNTRNILHGQRLQLADSDGQAIDLGFVGEVTKVNTSHLQQICNNGVVPFIPSMCIDTDGQKYNVNADTAATAVAVGMRADKLVFLSDVNGVRLDKDDPSSLIHSLNKETARQMMSDGQIAAGMIPKIESCFETLEAGVGKVHIIDGRVRHLLLLEIYTDSGIGTEIVL